MKKQLLTVACATFSFFTATAKPTNAEILTHLKQVKTELENHLQEFLTAENGAKQEWKYYTVLKHIWNDIADLPEYSHQRKVLANFYFDQICNHKKSISEIAEMKEVINAIVLVDAFFSQMTVNDKKQEKHEKILLSIIKKHRKDDPHQNDPLEIEDLEDQDSLVVGMAVDQNKMISIVLKKINEKIKTLER